MCPSRSLSVPLALLKQLFFQPEKQVLMARPVHLTASSVPLTLPFFLLPQLDHKKKKEKKKRGYPSPTSDEHWAQCCIFFLFPINTDLLSLEPITVCTVTDLLLLGLCAPGFLELIRRSVFNHSLPFRESTVRIIPAALTSPMRSCILGQSQKVGPSVRWVPFPPFYGLTYLTSCVQIMTMLFLDSPRHVLRKEPTYIEVL